MKRTYLKNPLARLIAMIAIVVAVLFGTGGLIELFVDVDTIPDWVKGLLLGPMLMLGPACAVLFLWSLGRAPEHGRCPRCAAPIDATGPCACRRCTREIPTPKSLRRPIRRPLLLRISATMMAAAVLMLMLLDNIGPFEMTGVALGAVGLGVLIWWGFGDGRRDRCRCRRCAYDMTSTIDRRCPECGRQESHQRRFFHTRRRRALLATGLLALLIAGISARVDTIREYGWRGAFPTTVLIAGLPVLPDQLLFLDDAEDAPDRPGVLEDRDPLPEWQRTFLTSRVSSALNRTDDVTEMHRLTRLLVEHRVMLSHDAAAHTMSLLIPVLLSEDKADREAAASAIVWLLPSFRPAHNERAAALLDSAITPHVETLLPIMLSDAHEPRVGQGASMLLGHATSDADRIGALAVERLGGSSVRRVLNAKWLLIYLVAMDDETADRLKELLDNPDPEVRFDATNVLGYVPGFTTTDYDASLADQMLEAVRYDPDLRVVEVSVNYLVGLDLFDVATDALLSAAESGDCERASVLKRYSAWTLRAEIPRIIARQTPAPAAARCSSRWRVIGSAAHASRRRTTSAFLDWRSNPHPQASWRRIGIRR